MKDQLTSEKSTDTFRTYFVERRVPPMIAEKEWPKEMYARQTARKKEADSQGVIYMSAWVQFAPGQKEIDSKGLDMLKTVAQIRRENDTINYLVEKLAIDKGKDFVNSEEYPLTVSPCVKEKKFELPKYIDTVDGTASEIQRKIMASISDFILSDDVQKSFSFNGAKPEFSWVIIGDRNLIRYLEMPEIAVPNAKFLDTHNVKLNNKLAILPVLKLEDGRFLTIFRIETDEIQMVKIQNDTIEGYEFHERIVTTLPVMGLYTYEFKPI